jgi:hypothetical protein
MRYCQMCHMTGAACCCIAKSAFAFGGGCLEKNGVRCGIGAGGGGRRLPPGPCWSGSPMRRAVVLRAARAGRGAGPSSHRPGRGNPVSGRRSRTRPAVASGRSRQRGDRAPAARVQAARIPHEACRPGGDPDHAIGKRLRLSFRPPDQYHRCAYLASALEDRQGIRATAFSYGARGRMHDT